MAGVTDLGFFILAGLLLNITPGPDVLYITGRSAAQGKWAGIVAAIGISTGCLVHIVGATLGVSAILLSSALLFTLLKFVGAAYLVYLGCISIFSTKGKNKDTTEKKSIALRVIFRQAILINALNPKVALFFLALLPQFVSPSAERPALAFLFLGLVFVANGTLVNIFFALFTASFAKRVQGKESAQRFFRFLSGSLFLTFGIRLAFFSE